MRPPWLADPPLGQLLLLLGQCFILLLHSLLANCAFADPPLDLLTAGQQIPTIRPPGNPEKPFQPKWSNSLGIRRRISRPTAHEGRNAKERTQQQQHQSQANLPHLKRPPPPSPAIGSDEWSIGGAGPAGEHKIVHLTSRPTQLYYSSQEGSELLGGDTVELGNGQVCRVKVPSSEVFYIAYEDGAANRPTVDLFFHCSEYWAWCCGVDCCQVDPTLLLIGLCICILVLALLLQFFLRSRFGRRFCMDRLFRRRKRVIARANAQRRKRSGSSTQTAGEMRRIRSNSLKETPGGKGHKKLAKACTREGFATISSSKTTTAAGQKGIPEIVITEPSSCYEPSSCNTGSECGEEEDEVFEEDEEEEQQ